MNIDLSKNEAWFVTGSQHLYGQETLDKVAEHSDEISSALNNSEFIPVKIKFIPTLTSPEAIRKMCLDRQKKAEMDRVDGWGSLVKVAGTDAGMENCKLALELMGQAGIRRDAGMEKIIRDARLLQIYEGTNEINRLNTFKRLIKRTCPEAASSI